MLSGICLAATSAAFDVPVAVIKSADRRRRIYRARSAAMMIMRELGGLSSPEIGRQVGGRDHTTVLNALRRATALVATDPEFAARFVMARDKAALALGQLRGDGSFHRHGSLAGRAVFHRHGSLGVAA